MSYDLLVFDVEAAPSLARLVGLDRVEEVVQEHAPP